MVTCSMHGYMYVWLHVVCMQDVWLHVCMVTCSMYGYMHMLVGIVLSSIMIAADLCNVQEETLDKVPRVAPEGVASSSPLNYTGTAKQTKTTT